MRKDPAVTRFVEDVPEGWRPVVEALRELVLSAAPELEEAIKYRMPSYGKGGIAVYIMPARDHVNLGFYDGVDLRDPKGLLEGTGKRLRHVKIRSVKEARAAALRALVKEAARARRTA